MKNQFKNTKLLWVLMLFPIFSALTLTSCAIFPNMNKESTSEESGGFVDSFESTPNDSDDDAVYHTVRFDTNGGNLISDQMVKHGDKIQKPDDPIKEGFNFSHWSYKGEMWSFIGYVCTEDMTLTAEWSEYFTVTFVNYDGEVLQTDDTYRYMDFPYYYSSTPTKPSDDQYRYEFIGWDKELMPVTCNTTYTATFEAVPYYFQVINDFGYGFKGTTAKTEAVYPLNNNFDFRLDYLSGYLGDLNNIALFNFVEPLLITNEYDALVNNLAIKTTKNDDYSSYTFTIKSGVPWVKHDGTQYNAVIDNIEVPQFVEPEDFLTTAKTISTYSTEAGYQYLIGEIIEGAQEYFHYTQIKHLAAQGNKRYINMLNKPAEYANEINRLIKEYSPTVYDRVYKENPITADDIENIKNGNRFGVKIDAAKRTVTYNLIMPAPYFPTLLKHQSFLPTNQHFLKEIFVSSFGVTKENFLYCGPYLVNSLTDSKIILEKNPYYWKAGENDTYLTDKITLLKTRSVNLSDVENGIYDRIQCGINSTLYPLIYGPDNTGNLENPYNENLIVSLSSNPYASQYNSNLVMGRDVASGGTTSYATGSYAETVRNTARALSLNPVRKAIMAALDYPTYFERYGDSKIEQTQQLVHTYVPKGLAINDDGEDYVAGNYLPYYAQQKGLPEGNLENPQPGTAAWYLKPGQYDSRIVSQEEMNELVDDAKASIALYNADQSHTPIIYPVRIEYFSAWFDTTTQTEDKKVISSMNLRLNKGSSTNSIFSVVPTDLINLSNYETASRNGYWDYAPVQWGWAAEYDDPLSFMNTYRKGGEWANIFPFVGFEECTNYNFNSTKTKLVKTDLLAEYTEIVERGKNELEDMEARYDLFAEAEYLLIEELNFFKPMVSTGQYWSATLTKTFDVHAPQNYMVFNKLYFANNYTFNELISRSDYLKFEQIYKAKKEEYYSNHNWIEIW